jgi:hypothetical protein
MMTTIKYIYLIGVTLLVLVILLAVGGGVLYLITDEVGDDGTATKGILPRISFLYSGDQENEGNEFTGQASGWLFGIASLPVVFCLTARFISRRVSLQPRLKGMLERFTRVNNKYFMPFHTYLCIPALIMAIVHLRFSSCPNPLPEWGLIITGILVATGMIIKMRIAPKISPTLVKLIYQFHTSLVVTGILISILIGGHVLMD